MNTLYATTRFVGWGMTWYKGGIDGLANKEEIERLIKAKASDKYVISESLSKVGIKQQEGWVCEKTKKTVAILSKQKEEYERFQDLVWVMLAEMGFSFLNTTVNTFKLPSKKDNEKQIDVFGIDEEDIVVIAECKAANQGPIRQANFRNDILEIAEYRGFMTQYLNKFFETKPKYIFLFCTSNYAVSGPDKELMKEKNIVWLDSNRVNYFRELTSQLGVLAKYQFLGEILEGKDIPALKDYWVPAIRAKMGDQLCYSMMLHPGVLLKLGFVLHRTDDYSRKGTYQRYVKKQRLLSINQYIKEGGFFPNSVIINFDEELEFQIGPQSIQHDENAKVGSIKLPAKYKSAFIIDGQHRLYGYADTPQKDTEVIPVIAFCKMPPEKQTNMFVDINTKAKAVKRNLIESLNGELYWNSPNSKYALTALNSMLALELNDRTDSPLYNQLLIGDSTGKSEKNEKRKGGITLTYFIDNGIKKENYFVIAFAKNGTPCSYGPFYGGDLADESLKKAYDVMTFYFNEIKSKCPQQWDCLLSNIGVSTLSWMLSEFLMELRKNNPEIYTNKTPKQIKQLISPRLSLLCEELPKKTPEEILKFFDGLYGYGGVDKARRHFEKLIYDRDNSFTQEGLEEWIIQQSGIYSEKTKELLDQLSERIVNIVEEILKKAYGEKTFFTSSKIPKKTGQAIFERMRDNPNLKHLIELQDVRPIILESWTENGFKDIFCDPERKGNKEETTEWLNKLVEVNNKINKNEKLSQFDFETVSNISIWFNKQNEN